jgi:hypothetical protein
MQSVRLGLCETRSYTLTDGSFSRIRHKARLADLGGTALASSPADFGKLIADETEKWRKVVKFSGAKAD